MKIALVFPGISETGFNKSAHKSGHGWINHGLCSLSACTKLEGHEVRLVDLRELSGWDEVRGKFKELKPDVVGITMMSVDFDSAVESAKIAKDCDRSVRVVAGGPHPSIVPEEVAKIPHIDHVVVGEGEISFVRLLRDIKDGRANEKIVTGEHPDPDRLPFADRELFGFHESPIENFLRPPFVTLIAGRGCVYNCSFCQPAERKIFGDRVRRRSVANIMSELRELKDRYDFQSLMFHDDCLTEDKEWVDEFCDSYKRAGFRQPFVCQSRADIICKNEDMIRKMKRAGLAMLLIGFESGSQRILKLLRKGASVETNYKAARVCKKYGIRIWANYMFGVPTETKEEALDTVKMIRAIKPYRPSPAFFTPHPGSDLYDYCEKNGLSLIMSHNGYSRSPNAPKIKGIDYRFLQEALKASKEKFLSVRLSRKLDFIIERRIKGAINRVFSKMSRYAT